MYIFIRQLTEHLLWLEALVSALKERIWLESRMEGMWALSQVKSTAGRSQTSCLTSLSLSEMG